MLLVQVIIEFLEAEGDLVEDLLPHCRQILEQLDFEGGNTRYSACSEPVLHASLKPSMNNLSLHHSYE